MGRVRSIWITNNCTINLVIYILAFHSAVIYTDTLQTVIMLIGAAIVAGKSMSKIGGWHGMNIWTSLSEFIFKCSDFVAYQKWKEKP